MKSHLHWTNCHRLERIFRQSPQKHHWLRTKLHDIWQLTIAHLDASAEPHVWQTQDGAGRIMWSAYHPLTGQVIHRVTAAELRTWLEEQHYQDYAFAERKAQQLKINQLCQLP
jgi:hypothetical protein